MYNFLETRNQKQFQEKLQKKMEEQKIDALLLTTSENISYSTGYISGMYGMWKFGTDIAVVPADGKVSLISSQFAQDGATLQTKGDVDVIGYPVWIFIEDYYDPNEKEKSVQPDVNYVFKLACDAIKSKKGNAVVGVERSSMPYDKYLYLSEVFGADRLVDISQFMIEVRTIKFPWEIDVLRYSAQVAQKMMNITMQYTEPGMTEADLFKIWWQTAYEITGGHEVVDVFQAHTPGPDFWATQMPRERQLENGDIVRLDGGVNIYGYVSDLGRVYAVGDHVAPEKQAIFDTLLAARDAGISKFVPGNKLSDVFHETMKVCKQGALPHFVRGHVGHTIGLGPGEEYPMLNPDNNMIFEPGMVFCFETPYYSSKYGSYNLEDTLVITENGHELFTHTNRSLFIK
jgi:Xaa-Pro aminopeptidase